MSKHDLFFKLKNISLGAMISLIVVFSFSGFKAFAEDEGKQLFQVCSACHTIGKGKLIGPDLKGVTERLDKDYLYRFIRNSQELVQAGDEYAVKQFEEYNKIPMPPNDLTDDQLEILLSYIENYTEEAVVETAPATTETHAEEGHGRAEYVFMEETEHPFGNLRISFIISAILIIIALIDLFFTHIIKARFVHLIIILISGAIVVEITVIEAQNLGRSQFYEPDQPIKFSHKIHAGDNKIDCKYCHVTAEESIHAGIPSVQLCMNCHNVVKEGTNTGKEEIAKIYQALETGKPIEWIKVHNLQDHVFFSHAQHVSVGKIDCEQCHGDVASMDRIRQVESLGMGWCIECHRNTEVQFLDNDFYTRYVKLHQELKSGERSRVTVDNIGGNECQKCHY
jgi:cytochrome c2